MLDAQEANKEGRRETGEGGVGGLVGRFSHVFPWGPSCRHRFAIVSNYPRGFMHKGKPPTRRNPEARPTNEPRRCASRFNFEMMKRRDVWASCAEWRSE